ncbi:MAG: PEP-utilizing enzyme [archaeon]
MFIKPFTALTMRDVSIAGGKGASLGEMLQAGIPVPDGFVILASTFDVFLKTNKLDATIAAILAKTEHEETAAVEESSRKIQTRILNAAIPKGIQTEITAAFAKLDTMYVAVRSSATAEDSSSAAWAGQLDSHLNTTKATLLENVKRCWSSLFTPRAIFYRFEQKLENEHVSVAVVVQKMVESERSGIAFTVHPVTQNRQELLIEAGYGLGEAIVSGQVTPDNYTILKNLTIKEKNLAEQTRQIVKGQDGGVMWVPCTKQGQTLSDKEIIELSQILLRIEKHYGFPSDIEWAYEKGKFYIVQSRPITTLTPEEPTPVVPSGQVMLTKIFSRQKSLMYMMMWDISERIGYKDFINYDLKHSVFIYDGLTRKTSVWYDLQEAEHIKQLLFAKVKADKTFVGNIIARLDKHWKLISPYLLKKSSIRSIKEFEQYYSNITQWWSAMNTVYPLINDPDLSPAASRTFLLYRERTERYTGEMDTTICNFWKKLLHSDLAEFVLLDEAIKLSKKEIPAERKSIEERKRGFGIYKGKLYTPTALKQRMEEQVLSLHKVETQNVQQFTGVTAFKGNVRGRVKKIIVREDIRDFRQGEILVAETTFPDHVPAMKKAAAIITDEGGITCHAAITARELKIPCIIGTKIATQTLSDGDLVEVDATAGIVRILTEQTSSLVDTFIADQHGKEITKHEGNFSLLVWGTAASLQSSPLYKKYYAGDFSSLLFLVEEKRGIGFFNMDAYKRCAEQAIDQYVHDRFPLLDACKKIFVTIKKMYDTYTTETLKTFSGKALEQIIILAFQTWRNLQVLTLFCEALDEHMVKAYADKEKIKIDINSFFEHASLCDFEEFLAIRDRALLEEKRPAWVLSSYLFTPKATPALINQLIKESGGQKKLREELQRSLDQTKKNKQRSAAYRTTLSGKVCKLYDYVKTAIALRDMRKADTFKNIAVLSDSVREMFKRMHLDEENIIYARAEDFEEKTYENKDYNALLQRRKHGVAVLYSAAVTKEECVPFEETRNKIFSVQDAGKEKDVTGNCACSGKAQGAARIILSSKDFEKFQQGDVLVTSMTRPEFVPLLKKASAIITDEGGITCHAAIISRELKIPCIIGTKHATRTIKDGQLLEINASAGVVRIIENQQQWTKLWEDRSYGLGIVCSAENSVTEQFTKRFDVAMQLIVIRYENGKSSCYCLTNDLRAGGQKIIAKIRTSDFAKKTINEVRAETEKLKSSISPILDMELQSKNYEQLTNMYRDVLQRLEEFYAVAFIPIFLETGENQLSDETERIIKEALACEKREKEFAEIFTVLLTPTTPSTIMEEELALLRTLKQLRGSPQEILQSILVKKHIRDWSWISFNFVDKIEWDESVYADRIRKILAEKKIDQKMREILDYSKTIQKKQESILKSIRFSKEELALITATRQFAEVKEYRKNIITLLFYCCFIILKELASKKKRSLPDMNFLTPNEIAEQKYTEAKERMTYSVILVKDGKSTILTGDTARKKAEELQLDAEEKIANVDELKGTPAQIGNAKGTVRIVNSFADVKKVQEGDILVSIATFPDLVPAMKRAGAIVTDEGGMTCHAAIISRELKKPCIIGTKIATKVLHDGDIVEVDANNGLVRRVTEKKTFTKSYTRDFSIIMEEAWYHGCTKGLQDVFGWTMQHLPFAIYYLNQGSIEVWENEKARKELLDRILEANKKTAFLQNVQKKYAALLKQLEPSWKKGYAENLPAFAQSLFAIMPYFVVQYYTALDERTPPAIRKLALGMRNTDVLFDCCDKIIRTSLLGKSIIRGVETCVLEKELEKIPPPNVLEERKKHFVVIPGTVEACLPLEKYVEQNPTVQLVHTKGDFDGQRLQGTCAFKGKASGTVRILRTKDQIALIQEGDVLVSPMTTPDFLPAMKKAAAIITDEGGITCHAAITARELKKPTVVGTEIATHVLKDGMYVEVDADNGLILLQKGQDNAQNNAFTKLVEEVKQTPMDIQKAQGNICGPDLVFPVYASASILPGTAYPLQLGYVKELHFLQMTPVTALANLTRSLRTMMNTPERFDAILKNAHKAAEQMDAAWADYQRNGFSSKTFDTLITNIRAFWQYGILGEDKGAFLESILIPLLVKNHELTQNEAHSLLSALTHPERPASFSKERLDFYNLCLSVSSLQDTQSSTANALCNKPLLTKLNRYVTEYFFKDTNFVDRKIVTPESVLADIQKELHDINAVRQSRKEILNGFVTVRKEREHATKKYTFSVEERKKLAFAQTFISFVDERKEAMMKTFYYFFSAIHDICDKLHLSYADVQWLTVDEIRAILNENMQFELTRVQQRKQGTMLVYYPGKPVIIYTGGQAEALYAVSQHEVYEATVKGMVASPAKDGKRIRGRARIITNPSTSTFNKGDVLVASMTRIEFVPLMKKAAAIITDEGGIACHAAIVSRELNIPCIIGTKNATQALKIGDLLEVDTTTGRVHVIERKTDMQELHERVASTAWYRQGGSLLPFFISTPYQCVYQAWGQDAGFIIQQGMDNIAYFNKSIEKEKLDEAIAASLEDKQFLQKKMKEWRVLVRLQQEELNMLLQEPTRDIRAFVKATIDAWAATLFIEETDPWGDIVLHDYLRTYGVSDKELAILTSPKHYGYLQQEVLDFWKAVEKGGALKKHHATYSWYLASWLHAPQLTEEHFLGRLHKKGKVGIRKEANTIRKHRQETERQRQHLLKKYAFDTKTRRVLDYFRTLNDWRDERKRELVCKTNTLLDQLIHRVCMLNAIPLQEAKHLAFFEISSLLLTEQYKEELKKRNQQSYAYWQDTPGHYTYLCGAEAEQLKAALEEALKSAQKDLCGRPAYPGKTQGIVRIINAPADFSKMNPGDILVSVMTRPELVPAMKKAGAIITDEGGITCHAAIISRELKIPCIVGTQLATTILKDGDVVEVDAMQGKVHKL